MWRETERPCHPSSPFCCLPQDAGTGHAGCLPVSHHPFFLPPVPLFSGSSRMRKSWWGVGGVDKAGGASSSRRLGGASRRFPCSPGVECGRGPEPGRGGASFFQLRSGLGAGKWGVAHGSRWRGNGLDPPSLSRGPGGLLLRELSHLLSMWFCLCLLPLAVTREIK